MIAFIEEKNPWEGVGAGLAEGYLRGADERAIQKSIESLGEGATPRDIINAVTNTKTYNPKAKQDFIKQQLEVGQFEELQKKARAAEEIARKKNAILEEKNRQTAEKAKAAPGGLGGVPFTPEESKELNEIVEKNPEATAEQLELELAKTQIPPGKYQNFIERRAKKEVAAIENMNEKNKELRKETLPYRKEIADRGFAAQQGIENKEKLMDLIDTGNIDDPTYAAIAEALPLNIGKRLLSKETTEYKSGLIDEYKDLRTIFKGATRVKEISLLEQKTADIYLTDDQKRAILKSRIKALKADIIRAEVAEELEGENLGILQFQRELEKRAKPRLDALFNQILDEQQAVIKDAENRKKVKLDINDPDDKSIMTQILIEAKGKPEEAKKIAKEKGYLW